MCGEFMRVSEFMSPNPLIINPDMNLLQALEIMAERDVWSPLVKSDRILGFLTERDLINTVVSQKIAPEQLSVADVASRRYGVVRPGDSYVDAASAMMKVKSRLVVMEGEEIVGVVTAADITRAYASSKSKVPLRPYATWSVVKIGIGESVERAVELMRRERIGCLLLEEEGEIVGIFTERDVVKGFLIGGGDYCDPVGKYATLKLITIDPNATLPEAARLMAENRVKRLPIVQEGKVIGIITARDVVEGIWRESTLGIMTP
jgi:CBS domain-containing protein